MPTPVRVLEEEMRTRFRRRNRMARLRQEGIVLRVYQQGRDPDLVEHRLRAAACPIVFGTGEAIHRGGVFFVEVAERPHRIEPLVLHHVRVRADLLADLGAQALEKPRHVNPLRGTGHLRGTGGEVTGNRDRCRRADPRIDVRPTIPEVFKGDIPAEAESDQRDLVVLPESEHVVEQHLQVAGGAAVVRVRMAVRLAATAAEIPRQDVPAAPLQGVRHPLDVVLGRAALQPVREDGEPGMAPRAPVEVEEITIRCLDPLAPRGEPLDPAEQGRVDRLQVTIAESCRGAVAGWGDDRHRLQRASWNHCQQGLARSGSPRNKIVPRARAKHQPKSSTGDDPKTLSRK